ncbi:MAG: AlkZ family DNA glycosylase [Chitinophagaceae bacterium]|nr:AlkZ family DNA glycosylase [Chitinophagaceae bacterium]
MKQDFIIQQRLLNQQIAAAGAVSAADVVSTMIALQAQEYQMAKWAIGLRSVGLTDALVESAFNSGKILRTHLLRPTWHFVTPADIHWLLELSAPRVQALNAYMYRQTNLSTQELKKSNRFIGQLLKGGNHLTRDQVQAALETNKIMASRERLSCIMMNAELEATICSGPRQGKQFTYALLDEKAPAISLPEKEKALQQFVARYFTTRGPATVFDFTTWSGLTMRDAKKAIESLPSSFNRMQVAKQELIWREVEWKKGKHNQKTFLLPDYDEYGMSYKDRSAIQDPNAKGMKASDYSHWLVVDGKIAGTWTHENHEHVGETLPFYKMNARQLTDIRKAVKKYEQFKGAASNPS